jgi:hypothetical protein
MAQGLVKTGATQSISFEESPFVPYLLPLGSVTIPHVVAHSVWLLFHILDISCSNLGLQILLLTPVVT